MYDLFVSVDLHMIYFSGFCSRGCNKGNEGESHVTKMEFKGIDSFNHYVVIPSFWGESFFFFWKYKLTVK